MQVRNFIDIFMPTAFLIKIFAIKINKHLNYWTIISINCNTSLNTSDCRRTDRTPGLKVDPRAEQGPGGGMQAFSLQNGQSKQGCMWQVCPPEGMTWDSSRAAESRLCPLWASLNISMSGLVWYCGSSGVTVIEVPLSNVPRCSLTWPQSISLWSCAYTGLVLKLTDQWCLNNLDTQLAIRTSSFFFSFVCFLKSTGFQVSKKPPATRKWSKRFKRLDPGYACPNREAWLSELILPCDGRRVTTDQGDSCPFFFLSGSRNIDNTGS